MEIAVKVPQRNANPLIHIFRPRSRFNMPPSLSRNSDACVATALRDRCCRDKTCRSEPRLATLSPLMTTLLRDNDALERGLGHKAQMALLPLQGGDVPDTESDAAELIPNLGYRPATSAEEDVDNFARRQHVG